MRGHTDMVKGIVRLPGGRRIITCSSDGSLRIWDLKSGRQIGNDWRDGGNETGVNAIALSPNGKVLASGSSDRKVRLWDIETGKVISRWTGHSDLVWRVCWSTDGQRLVSGSWDGMVKVWDVANGRGGKAMGSINMRAEHDYVTVTAVMCSPNMTMIATGRLNDHAIKIWDSETCELLSTATVKHKDAKGAVFSLAWTSDQKRLISGSRKGQIRIFDTATWRQTAILQGHQDIVHAISLFQNDRLLASASYDRTARLWDLHTNLPLGLPMQHEDHVLAVAISADGKLLFTGCADNNVYVWDVQTILKDAGLEDFLSIPDVSINAAPTLPN
jgi:WD40 repeat protein